MKASDMRDMEPAIMLAEIEKTRRKLLDLRFKSVQGEEIKPSLFRANRRDIARYMTVLREKGSPA